MSALNDPRLGVITAMRVAGATEAQIAAELSVSRSTVSRLLVESAAEEVELERQLVEAEERRVADLLPPPSPNGSSFPDLEMSPTLARLVATIEAFVADLAAGITGPDPFLRQLDDDELDALLTWLRHLDGVAWWAHHQLLQGATDV